MITAAIFTSLLVSYLLGSFSLSYHLVEWKKHRDIRTMGTKNAGASNAYLALGIGAYVVVVASDAGKGILAVFLGWYLGLTNSWLIACAIAAILGHIFPFYLRFRGGKGFATFCGSLAALWTSTIVFDSVSFAMIISYSFILGVPYLAYMGYRYSKYKIKSKKNKKHS